MKIKKNFFLYMFLLFWQNKYLAININFSLFKQKISEKIEGLFKNIEEIETERLILKKPIIDDAYEIFKFMSNEKVYKYIDYMKPHKSIDDTILYIQLLNLKTNMAQSYWWSAYHKKDKKIIGLCGLSSINFKKKIGYLGAFEHPSYWNQGFGTEGTKAIIKFAKEKLGLSIIKGITKLENLASQKVLEKNNLNLEQQSK